MDIILLIVGFVLLIKCADIFVDGCSNIAKFLGIPTLIIGLTIVAFGTSAPEAAVSLSAALKGNNAISIGNVVGSNIANLLLILGSCSAYACIKTEKKVVKRDFVFALISAVMLLLMVLPSFIGGASTALIGRFHGVILLGTLGYYLYLLVKDAKKESDATKEQEEEKRKFNFKDIIFILLGIAGIIIGGQLVVDSAVAIAKAVGVTDHVIALTVVAIGTSLPELVTSIVATRKGEIDIAIGNVIGSNIFNILFILGITSLVCPLAVVTVSLIDMIIMLAISVIVFLFMYKKYELRRWNGVVMLLMYLAYMAFVLIR